jgi:hypothetical protein
MFAQIRLVLDILTVKLLVRLLGRDGELLDSHHFFFDRYSELARHHRRSGRTARADALQALAEIHRRRSPDDDEPPRAAAMAKPVPRAPVFTNAVSTVRIGRFPRQGRGVTPG